MNTHICLFINTMPKYIHSNINPIYTYANTDVIKHAHTCIYIYTHTHTHIYIYIIYIYVYIHKQIHVPI